MPYRTMLTGMLAVNLFMKHMKHMMHKTIAATTFMVLSNAKLPSLHPAPTIQTTTSPIMLMDVAVLVIISKLL